MNLLIATGLYPPEIGGPATYTKLLEDELPAHGHTVSVVPFRVSRSWPKVLRHLHFAYRVYRAARGVDLIYAQDVASVGLPARLAAWLRGVPFWVRVPGDYAWEQATQRFGVTDDIDTFQTKSYGFRVTALRRVQQFVTKTAAHVITPSDYFTALVTGWGVSSDRIETIYNGVDLNVEPAVVDRPAGKVMVSAGRLVPWKGFATVISTLPQLPEWQLVILGDGPERENLATLANELAVADRVHFKGQVSRQEVFGWDQAADVFVLQTSFESFSYQVVEAMSVGTPVIITPVGSLPEVAGDEPVGSFVAVGDRDALVSELTSVTSDPAVWQARGQQAKRRARTFTITATIAAFCRSLENITA